MKSKVCILSAFVLTFLSCGTVKSDSKIQGNGDIITKEINVSEFNEISIGSGISSEGNWGLKKKGNYRSPVFNYSQKNKKATLEITIDKNLYPYLEITSSNGKLSIRSKDRNRLLPTRFVAKASSRELKKVTSSGVIDFVLQSSLSGDELEISVSGSSDIKMNEEVRLNNLKISVSGSADVNANNLKCEYLSAGVSGSGDINLKGSADRANYRVSGSGDIRAFDFDVKDLECSVSGSGDIKAYASGTLKASASGSGDIQYKGNAEAKTSKSGSGGIKRVD